MTSSLGTPLPSFLQSVQGPLDHYCYGAVGALIFFESLGAPLPGETVLIAASVYAGTGRLSITAIAAIAAAAAILGDNTAYAVGRFGGARVLARFGRLIRLTPGRLARAEAMFARRGGGIVFVARFIALLRQLNGLLAGTARLRWRTFVAADAAGSVLWVAAWSALGYFAGNRLDAWRHDVTGPAGWAVGAAVVVVLIAAWLLHRRRRAAPLADDQVE